MIARKLANKIHIILFIQTQEYVEFCCYNIISQTPKMLFGRHRIFSQEFSCISSNMKAILFYPMYPFTMYSLRGTWSVGVTGWFCLLVVFYVFDEWFWGS